MPTDSLSSDQLIEQPVFAGVRSVALDLLKEVARARARLGPGGAGADPEAVHAFRVALRRLRSWERAFREELEPSVSRKARRRLRGFARAANPSRDTFVHLQWLREQVPTLTRNEHVGVAWLIESLEGALGVSEGVLVATVERDFEKVYRRVKKGLKEVPFKKAWKGGARLGEVAAGRIMGGAEVLREKLVAASAVAASVESKGDLRVVHEARIAGKRLRYVLEPFAKEVEGVDVVVERLKRLQDVAGDFHDVHVFANDIVAAAQVGAAAYAKDLTLAVVRGDVGEAARAQRENPTPGVLAVAARLRERGAAGFEELRGEWLSGEAGGEIIGWVRGVAERMRRS